MGRRDHPCRHCRHLEGGRIEVRRARPGDSVFKRVTAWGFYRFMRSLAQYMLDPSLRWIGALDGHYHDQAQFVRDFRQFMGMTPREYALLDKPVLGAIMRERARIAGNAVQTLDGPDGGAPSAERPQHGAPVAAGEASP